MNANTEFVSTIVENDPDAIRFMGDVTLALAFWYGISGGQQIPVARAHRSMWAALFDLPSNPFYRKHFDALHPVLRMTVLQWFSSIAIQGDTKATDDALMLAFIDGQAWTQVLMACSLAIRGGPATAQLAPAIRKFGLGAGFAKYRNDLLVARDMAEQAKEAA